MASFEAGNLYDMNKQLVKKYDKELKGKAFINKKNKVILPYLRHKIKSESYFMLLCHEDRNYTVFHLNDDSGDPEYAKNLLANLEYCLHNRGKIFSVEITEDKVALEIWIQNDNEEMQCYYFFPYTQAVVEC